MSYKELNRISQEPFKKITVDEFREYLRLPTGANAIDSDDYILRLIETAVRYFEDRTNIILRPVEFEVKREYNSCCGCFYINHMPKVIMGLVGINGMPVSSGDYVYRFQKLCFKDYFNSKYNCNDVLDYRYYIYRQPDSLPTQDDIVINPTYIDIIFKLMAYGYNNRGDCCGCEKNEPIKQFFAGLNNLTINTFNYDDDCGCIYE